MSLSKPIKLKDPEQFVPITKTNFNGIDHYEISNWGRVLNSRTGLILKNQLNNKGYYIIGLRNTDGDHKLLISRLVALHFIPNPNGHPEVDHDDRDPKNNYFKNLIWSTKSDNIINKSKLKNTSSKFKGVSFHKDANKYRSKITINKKLIHLGLFETEQEAYQARVAYVNKNNLNQNYLQ